MQPLRYDGRMRWSAEPPRPARPTHRCERPVRPGSEICDVTSGFAQPHRFARPLRGAWRRPHGLGPHEVGPGGDGLADPIPTRGLRPFRLAARASSSPPGWCNRRPHVELWRTSHECAPREGVAFQRVLEPRGGVAEALTRLVDVVVGRTNEGGHGTSAPCNRPSAFRPTSEGLEQLRPGRFGE